MAAANELSRRTALLSISSSRTSRICRRPSHPFNTQQRRTAFEWLTGKSKPKINPLSEDFLRRQRAQREKPSAEKKSQQAPEGGTLGADSVFGEEVNRVGDEMSQGAGKQGPGGATRLISDSRAGLRIANPLYQADVLDPNPRQRVLQERKYIVRSIKRRYRIDEKTRIARLERMHDCKSNEIKGSVRKLMPLARQIINKPIDEAILQMRWSKKGAAQDFLKHLIYARDQATVVKGMGLPRQGTQTSAGILDRDNKFHKVKDTTQIYVDEAWLNKGEQEFGLDYRARGRMHRLDRPFTTLTLRLKEEATRIRLDKERNDKELKKKPWTQLPDRNIAYQRQIPLW